MSGKILRIVKQESRLIIQSLYSVDDHQFKDDELEKVGEMSKVCSRIVLTCFFLARVGRPDISWFGKSYHQMEQSM